MTSSTTSLYMVDRHLRRKGQRSKTPLPAVDVDGCFIESQEKPPPGPVSKGEGRAGKKRKTLELDKELDAWALIDELETEPKCELLQRVTLICKNGDFSDETPLLVSETEELIDLAILNDSFNEAFESPSQNSVVQNHKISHNVIQHQESLRTYSSTRSFLEDDNNEANDMHQPVAETHRKDTIQDINNLRHLGVSNKIKDEYQFMAESFEAEDISLMQTTLFDLLQRLQRDERMLKYFHHMGFPKSLLESNSLKSDTLSKLIFIGVLIFMSNQDLNMTYLIKSIPDLDPFLTLSRDYRWPDKFSAIKRKSILNFQKLLQKIIGGCSPTVISLHFLITLAKIDCLPTLKPELLSQLDSLILQSIREKEYQLLSLELDILESLVATSISSIAGFTCIGPLLEQLFENRTYSQLSKQRKTLFSSVTAIGVIYTKSMAENDKLYNTFLSCKAIRSLLHTVYSSCVLSNSSSVQRSDAQLYNWGCFSLGWLLNVSKFPRCFECIDQQSVSIIYSILESMGSSVDLNIGYISMFIGRLYQENVLIFKPDSPILHNLRTFKKLITLNTLNAQADSIIKDLEKRIIN